MATFTDFKNGLQDFNDYISPTHHIQENLLGDSNFLAVQAELDYNLKDIICALLAGQGLQLPNLQICLSAAIDELLKQPIQGALRDALSTVADAMAAFQENANINGILGQLNGVIDEVAAVGSMINFCAAPVDPVSIPNMLENAFGSFLGSGLSIINSIGNILPGDLCACIGLDGNFNTSSLNGGALKDIFDNLDNILSGNFAQGALNDLIGSLNSIADDIGGLIALEGLFNANYTSGGSALHGGDCSSQFNIPRSIGVCITNTNPGSVKDSLSFAAQLRGTFEKLGGYPVVGQVSINDTKGTKLQDQTNGGTYSQEQIDKWTSQGLESRSFNNIFELLVEPEMLELLKKPNNYEKLITNIIPIYDYCGNIIRYESVIEQGSDSTTTILTSSTDSSVSVSAPGVSTSRTTTNTGATTVSSGSDSSGSGSGNAGGSVTATIIVVNSESGMVSLDVINNAIIYRTDLRSLFGYINNQWIELTAIGVRTINGTNNEIIATKGNNDSYTIGLHPDPIVPGLEKLTIPASSSNSRPGNPINGDIRFNTTVNSFEFYNGSWLQPITNVENAGNGTSLVQSTTTNSIKLNSISNGSGINLTNTNNNIEINNSHTFSGKNSITVTKVGNDHLIHNPYIFITTFVTNNDNYNTLVFNDDIQPSLNETWFFIAHAIGKGTSKINGFKLEGIVDNRTGLAIIGDVAKTTYQNTAQYWDFKTQVTNDWNFQVKGDSVETVNWKIKLEILPV